MDYYIFAQMGYRLSLLCLFYFALLSCQFAQMGRLFKEIIITKIKSFHFLLNLTFSLFQSFFLNQYILHHFH
jgi:hypothetical protein